MTSARQKRLPADERRQQLLDTAIDLFSKNGFDGTTTKSIAAAAGVSEAIIFRHFATKEDLYSAILQYKAKQSGQEHWYAELRAFADSNDDRQLFYELARKVLESYRTDPQFRRVMLYASLEGHEIARLAERTMGLPIFHFLCSHIERRQKEGVFRQVDPGVVALALAGVTSFYGMVKRLFGVEVLDLPDEQVAAQFVDLLLHGLRVPGPADLQSSNRNVPDSKRQ